MSHEQQLLKLKEVFQDAYEESDLLAVLEDVRWDLQMAVDRISEGNITIWEKKVTNKSSQKKGNSNLNHNTTKNDKSRDFNAAVDGNGKRGPNYRGISSNTSTRGGRGGGRGGRSRGGRGGYSNSDRSTAGHGGEKSNGKFTAPSAEPWDSSAADPASLANTDDWGSTAVKASDQDWNSSNVEQDFSRLSITKKGFTVVKVKNNPATQISDVNAALKKSNWASIVKGPDPPAPTPVAAVAPEKTTSKEINEKKAQTSKKLTLVKKDAHVQPAATAALTSTPPATSAKAISSPIERATELSPVIASHLPVKSPQPSVENTSLTQTQPQESSPSQQPNLPPGLGVNSAARQQQQQQKQIQQVRKTKQTSPVVMPVQPNSVSSIPATAVQFGSFGITKTATSTGTDPIKSPDRPEETTSNSFQFNPPQSTSTATQSSRPASASATTNDSGATAVPQMGGAPGLPGHYQQQQFGLGGVNYSMYDNDQQRVMGYYGMPDAVQQSYGTTKYAQPDAATTGSSQTPATHTANPAAHLPQQSFQPYPYYPYYMNQYQQAPYQQPLYQQQHFGSGKGGVYGAAGFQSSSASTTANGKVGAPQTGVQGITQNGNAYAGYGAQQFYPNSYEEHDYSKSNAYGQQNFSFGGQQVKTEYKAQNRARPTYEKQSAQSSTTSASGQQTTSSVPVPQSAPAHASPYGYANAQQFPGMQYPFMMHPAQGYPQNPGYQGRGYWGGNQ